MASSSAYGVTHPPRSNPPLRSSSGPPSPCITPSTVTIVVVVSFMVAAPFSLVRSFGRPGECHSWDRGLGSSARIASIWPTACVRPSSMPMAASCSIASTVGNSLSIDIRVLPPPMSWIVTCIGRHRELVFGVPSSLAKPSRKTSRCGGWTSSTFQYPRG